MQGRKNAEPQHNQSDDNQRKGKLTSENNSLWTRNDQQCILTFLSKNEAAMMDTRAWFVDSDIAENVMLPTNRYSGYISGVMEPLRL